jgi:hypothetical protein
MNREERQVRTALMTYAADRARIERVLPAYMLWHCCRSIGAAPSSTEADKAWWAEVMQPLRLACLEPLDGLPELRWHTAKEAARLTTSIAMADLRDRPIITATMSVLRWLEALLANDVLDLVEGTAIDYVVDRVMSEVQRHEDLAADVDRSARKMARHIHTRLQGLGLYKGADVFSLSHFR